MTTTFTGVTSAMLPVPGAQLYYERQGTGPTLLLIPGGPTDAGVFADLAAQLADRYTVVAYDPRGNSRSTLIEEPADQDLDVHADDAARLIEALGNGPANVFGTSGGAQIGLNLAARHPALVRTLVAHEPPCARLLPDAEAVIAQDRAVHATYQREGLEAAMQQFMALAGLEDEPVGADAMPPDAMPPALAETFARIEGNMAYFLAHGLLPLSLYLPDVATLRAGAPRVVVGVGAETAGEIAHRTGLALAAALGSEPVTFPGDHGGYGPHAAEFASVLHRSLATAAPAR